MTDLNKVFAVETRTLSEDKLVVVELACKDGRLLIARFPDAKRFRHWYRPQQALLQAAFEDDERITVMLQGM